MMLLAYPMHRLNQTFCTACTDIPSENNAVPQLEGGQRHETSGQARVGDARKDERDLVEAAFGGHGCLQSCGAGQSACLRWPSGTYRVRTRQN